MKMKTRMVGMMMVCALSLSLMLVCGSAFGKAVDFETLLAEMTDMERLAVKDSVPYTLGQFSSYDRKSTDPAVQTEENWFANYDRNQHLRTEEVDGRTEWVLMDADGPGAVVRFWSANPNEGGIVRFYLDHSTEPVIEMPLEIMLGGRAKPFIAPLCGERSRGWNSFLPIPYEKHCKVTIDAGDIYYAINYRTYESGTRVRTFTMGGAEEAMAKVRATAATLVRPADIADTVETESNAFDMTIEGADSDDMTLPGPAAIRGILCRVEAEDMENALRGCLLKISFDGNAPAVIAPLGDFFGTAPGINPYQSLPSGVLEDGVLYSRWVMPFKEEAVVEVINFNRFAVHLQGEIKVAERRWTDESMYFHAKWRGERDIPTRPMQDWNYLAAEGAGRFCGVMLHITNPVSKWWGEGDEKIYVDGATFPNFFGTGTEDYFGYAWCSTALFSHAYHNQPRCDGPGNFGQTCVSRFHIMDSIPFSTAFRFDLEVWHWADTRIAQSVIAYWYGTPGATDNFGEPDPALLSVPTYPEPVGVEGALEGERMKAFKVSAGTVDSQSGEWPWSCSMQLWWRDANPGDTLKLRFPIEKAGSYEVVGVFTKAPDYGIHSIAVNDVVVAPSLDLYHESVVVSEPISLGRAEFKQGFNFIDVKILDKNPASTAYMFGLDYVLLKP